MGSADARTPRSAVPRPTASDIGSPPRKPTVPRRLDAGRRPNPPRAIAEPTVLVIGADESFLPALRLALARHQVYVETSLVANAVETVVVTAPDLVLLVGEAARDAGRGVLTQLTSSPVSSIVPVALLGDETALEERLRAFRHGAAAIIPRSASVDAIAEQVARFAREIPERGGDALGQIGEATLAEFVHTLQSELRSGILSLRQGASDVPVRLVLGSGRPLAAFIDDFVKRVKRHVIHAEPLEYEFDDRAVGTVQVLANESHESEPPPGNIEGLRLVLADDQPARTDVIAQELRARGASVVVTAFDPDPSQFARLRQLDPEVLVMGESELEGAGYRLVKRMKGDTRLRWASLLVVRWHEIWADALAVPAIDRIRGALAMLAEPDRGLFDRSELGDAFDARLEVTGPARCLRALSKTKNPLRLSLHNARILVEIDLSDGLVVGASARSPGGDTWEGAPALAAFLVLSTGRLCVDPVRQPATTNVMATVDVALNLAESEAAPIMPSIPVAALASEASRAVEPSSVEASVTSQPTKLDFNSLFARWRGLELSPRMRIGLVTLAALSGLSLVLVLARSVGSSQSGPSAQESSSPEPLGMHTGAPPETPPALVAQPTPAPVAPVSTLEEREPLDTLQPTAGVDESGFTAPSCESLLEGFRKDGNYPGAAYEQVVAARKALVKGEVDEAQRSYCKAIRWDAKNANHYFELAQLLLLRRDGAACAEWARRGLELQPTSTRGHSLLGDGLVRLNETEGARRAWYAAASLNTPSAQEVSELTKRALKEAEQALARRDFSRAERFFRRAATLHPESSAALVGLSNALLRLGETAPAIQWAERAFQLAPQDPLVHFALGDAALAAEERARAKQAYVRAGELGHPDAARRLRRLE